MKDHELLNAISDMMDDKLEPLKTDISELKTDVDALKTVVPHHSEQIAELQQVCGL